MMFSADMSLSSVVKFNKRCIINIIIVIIMVMLSIIIIIIYLPLVLSSQLGRRH